jgi:hypothetical protein
MGQKWMSKILTWIQFAKHPDTHPVIYRNVKGWDQVRMVLKDRCFACDCVVSSDAKSVKEIYVQSKQKTVPVCDVCYNLHHSLYMNYSLKNMNYFRNIDEAEQKEQDKRKRGW